MERCNDLPVKVQLEVRFSFGANLLERATRRASARGRGHGALPGAAAGLLWPGLAHGGAGLGGSPDVAQN